MLAASAPLTGLERPVIAIHPFQCASQDYEKRNTEIASEIGAVISRNRWVTVGSASVARYHVTGKLRNSQDGTLVLVTTLSDAATGRTVWADRWSGSAEGTHGIPEYAAVRIAIALDGAVRAAEVDRVSRMPREKSGSWELIMRALPLALTIDALSQSQALELLEHAMERAPDDPLPNALAAWCHAQRGTHHFTTNWMKEKRASQWLAQKVARLDGADARAEALLGAAETLAHDLDAGKRHCDRALALDSSCTWGWIRLGFVYAYGGHSSDAIECFQIARSLNPRDPLIFSCSIGMGVAYFEVADYGRAIKWWNRLLAEHPPSVWAHRFLAPAYLMVGRKEEASRSFNTLLGNYRELTTSDVRSALPHTKQYMDRACDGLGHLGMRP